MITYDEVARTLRAAYDGSAQEREQGAKQPWKVSERAAFLERLRAEGATRLLEVGAGTGQDSHFFQQAGLTVVATDLSPAMVEHCRAKGVEAHVMDFLHLDFPEGSFDAIYALNCLLHVPNADLPAVLGSLRGLLRPGGLFYLGLYGGTEDEGVNEADTHVPPRFFSWRRDDQIRAFAQQAFEIVDFHVLNDGTPRRFQSLTLRRPAGAAPVERADQERGAG